MLGQTERLKAAICAEIDRVTNDAERLTQLVVTVILNDGGFPRTIDVERKTRNELARAVRSA